MTAAMVISARVPACEVIASSLPVRSPSDPTMPLTAQPLTSAAMTVSPNRSQL